MAVFFCFHMDTLFILSFKVYSSTHKKIINFSNCMDSSVEQNKSPVLQIMTGFL